MTKLSPSLRIGVLRGGPSFEYDFSLKSGAHVLQHLSETHRPIDIFISKDGTWHMQGVEKSPERILKNVDVVFNTLHGEYGEDGGVQEILKAHGVPHTGSNRLSSAMAMNKWITKDNAEKVGINIPIYTVVKREEFTPERATDVWNAIPRPLIIKPVTGGFSHGVYFVDSYNQLLNSLETVLSMYPSAMIEEYIEGKEISCSTTEDFRGEKTYAFPPIEIQYNKRSPVWRHEMKQYGDTNLLYPSSLNDKESKSVEDFSRLIHDALSLQGYSQSDFIVSPKRGVYFLEVNTSPDLSDNSLLHKSTEAVGSNIVEFLHHVLLLALR